MNTRSKLLMTALPAALMLTAQAAQAQQQAAQAQRQGAPASRAAPAANGQAAQPRPAPAAQAPARQAQAPAAAGGIAPGARVSDPQGGEVGTVTRLDGQFLILKTDKHEARLPVSSFTPHQGGLVMAMTRDQLNAEIDKTIAQAAEKIGPGAKVMGSQGGLVGTIESADAEFVTVKLTSGKMVRLPRSGVAPSSNGAVIGMTVAQLEELAASPPK